MYSEATKKGLSLVLCWRESLALTLTITARCMARSNGLGTAEVGEDVVAADADTCGDSSLSLPSSASL